MIVVHDRSRDADHTGPIVVFGAGLVGSGIVRALRRARPSLETVVQPLSWTDRAARLEQLSKLRRFLGECVAGGGRSRMRLVWSAGRAGFASSETETANELITFGDVLATAVKLTEELPAADVDLRIVSSAGGLFEGQRLVDRQSMIAPRRPYGELKAKQEAALFAAPGRLAKHVYRVSSVYGFIDTRYRMGLIPTLLCDGLRRQVSTIAGSPSTLRDFVWLEDVGRYIALDILSSSRRDGEARTVYLCSGRPTALGEVKHHVEEALGRRLYVVFSVDRTNADITFAPRLLPADWQPLDLRLSILEALRAAIARGWESARLSPERGRIGL
jgi:nucleoside-diphosphate-sugar epimerase